MRPVNVGGMRERITIMRAGEEVVDANGNASIPYTAVRTVPAEMRHQSDREYVQSGGSQLERIVYFKIRQQVDLLPSDRLVCRGVPYEIEERHPLDDVGLFERIRAQVVRPERS